MLKAGGGQKKREFSPFSSQEKQKGLCFANHFPDLKKGAQRLHGEEEGGRGKKAYLEKGGSLAYRISFRGKDETREEGGASIEACTRKGKGKGETYANVNRPQARILDGNKGVGEGWHPRGKGPIQNQT